MSRFRWVGATDYQVKVMEEARERLAGLESFVERRTLRGRYQRLALTALEEASMWLNKAITHGGIIDPKEWERMDEEYDG